MTLDDLKSRRAEACKLWHDAVTMLTDAYERERRAWTELIEASRLAQKAQFDEWQEGKP